MITIHIVKGQLHFTCNSADDTAQLDNWIASEDPTIYIKEFYGMSNAEPAEYEVNEGGLPLSQIGYLTRSLGASIWNSKVLKTEINNATSVNSVQCKKARNLHVSPQTSKKIALYGQIGSF
jgi:hypothetical protein